MFNEGLEFIQETVESMSHTSSPPVSPVPMK